MTHWIIHHGNMQVLQKNKRVQTFKMVFQYIYIKKKRALPNKYSPICGILWLTKQGKKTLELYNLFSSYQIYYLFPPSFALTF